jgi:hypothetical protein
MIRVEKRPSREDIVVVGREALEDRHCCFNIHNS